MTSIPFPDLRQKIEYLPLSSLKADPLNPRIHPASQVKALAGAIRKFGFVGAVLVNQANTLIAGHCRVEAAKSIGITEVPAVRLEHLSPAEQRALMIADNKICDLSSFSEPLLIENFRLLQVEDLALDLETTGFAMCEIDLMLKKPVPDDKPDPDDTLAEQADCPPVNRVGDLWQLGSHRLACGSALDPAIWDNLMAGEKAAMSISDVPYNVKIAGHVSGLGTIKHQNFVQGSGEFTRPQFTAFLESAFTELARNSVSGSLHYTFIDWRSLGEMQAAGDAAFTELKNVIVWDKGAGGGMGSLYRSAHELVFLWKSGRAKHINNVQLGRWGRNRTNIWHYPGIRGFRHSDEGDLLALHSTPKPVRMIADAMLDVTRRGDLVLDAFLGSGTAIIAAERVGRRCYGCELDPKYADTIIARYQRHSGEAAIHMASGMSFAEITAERTGPVDGEADHG